MTGQSAGCNPARPAAGDRWRRPRRPRRRAGACGRCRQAREDGAVQLRARGSAWMCSPTVVSAGAVDKLDRQVQRIERRLQRGDLVKQLCALQGVGAQAVPAQGERRAYMGDIAGRHRVGLENRLDGAFDRSSCTKAGEERDHQRPSTGVKAACNRPRGRCPRVWAERTAAQRRDVIEGDAPPMPARRRRHRNGQARSGSRRLSGARRPREARPAGGWSRRTG